MLTLDNYIIHTMKCAVTCLATLLYLSGYPQTDTIRIFDHLKPFDKWQLKMSNKNSFTLLSNNLFSKDKIIIKGIFTSTDSTIKFICDTSKLKDKYLAQQRFKKFSNIPYIVNGNPFVKFHNYFLPININEDSSNIFTTPRGLYAKYYRGDGFGSNIIELKTNMTYVIYDFSCVAGFEEEGRWVLDNNEIIFTPSNKESSMLDWFTQNKKMFVSDEYLIGKKQTQTYTRTKRVVITETYYYLSKQPSQEENTFHNNRQQ